MWELLKGIPWWGWTILCFVVVWLLKFFCDTAQRLLADENECERPKSLIDSFFSGRKR